MHSERECAGHVGPGKFEAASCAVVAFFEQDADDVIELPSGGYWQEFRLTAADRDEWPELAGQDVLRIFEDSYGAVYQVSWRPEPEPEDDDDGHDDGCEELPAEILAALPTAAERMLLDALFGTPDYHPKVLVP